MEVEALNPETALAFSGLVAAVLLQSAAGWPFDAGPHLSRPDAAD